MWHDNCIDSWLKASVGKGAAMIKSSTGVCIVAVAFLALAGGAAQRREHETPQGKQLSDSFRGPELFKAYCATCHGKDGKSGGPMAASLRIAPADLTRIAARNGGTFPFLQVQKIISGEQQTPPTHGTREMPVWGPIFSEVSWDQDLGRVRIYSLARYLETIQVR
jgi:mono/diheme cytochrome c family protein